VDLSAFDPTVVPNLPLPPNVRTQVQQWLEGRRYASDRPALARLVMLAGQGDPAALAELADAFSGVLPIGTGGRRGVCGPGPNRLNVVVLRETVQGLAEAMRAEGVSRKVAVVYDTRRDSRRFAYTVASQLAANDLDVLVLDAPRPTPQLSFTVRRARCGAGVVISASHNPPEDNGIKIYDCEGAQVLGARDAALMSAIQNVDVVPELASPRTPWVHSVVPGPALDEQDASYHAYVLAQGVLGSLAPAKLTVTFTPLHGVGHTSVVPILQAKGVTVHCVAAQCDPDGGRFSTVKSANPEVPESMELALALAHEHGDDLVLATDPDADRLGACVARPDGSYQFLDGNRLAVLMLDHVLRRTTPSPYALVLTTLVTTPLIGELARAHGVECVDDLLVGFKHHAGMMAEHPERPLVFGCEESHGYVRGNEIRDKDAAIGALLLCESAADAKCRGRDLISELERIWITYGYHVERTANLAARGIAGREAIAAVMTQLRTRPPERIASLSLVAFEDRLRPRETGSNTRDLPGDVLVLSLQNGTDGHACRVVVRPSGTEPKLKVYALASAKVGSPRDLAEVRANVDALIMQVLADAKAGVEAIMAPILS